MVPAEPCSRRGCAAGWGPAAGLGFVGCWWDARLLPCRGVSPCIIAFPLASGLGRIWSYRRAPLHPWVLFGREAGGCPHHLPPGCCRRAAPRCWGPRDVPGAPLGVNSWGAPSLCCSWCHTPCASCLLGGKFGEAKLPPASIDSSVRGAGGKHRGEPSALPGQNQVGTGTGLGIEPGPWGLNPSWVSLCPIWVAPCPPEPGVAVLGPSKEVRG